MVSGSPVRSARTTMRAASSSHRRRFGSPVRGSDAASEATELKRSARSMATAASAASRASASTTARRTRVHGVRQPTMSTPTTSSARRTGW
jgi:hypothetical protein